MSNKQSTQCPSCPKLIGCVVPPGLRAECQEEWDDRPTPAEPKPIPSGPQPTLRQGLESIANGLQRYGNKLAAMACQVDNSGVRLLMAEAVVATTRAEDYLRAAIEEMEKTQ